jgi:hypothetical protein
MVSKYDPLGGLLARHNLTAFTLLFDEIEKIIGAVLPPERSETAVVGQRVKFPWRARPAFGLVLGGL